MRSTLKKSVLVVSTVFLLLFIFLFYVSYGYGLSLRKAAIISEHNTLKEALIDLQKNGRLTFDYGRHVRVFIFTNNVTVNGASYQCAVAVESDRFNGEGILAATTNEVLVWLDKKRDPKIIGANYNPPLFPPGF